MSKAKAKIDAESLTVVDNKKKRAVKRAEVEISKKGFKKKYIGFICGEGAPIDWSFFRTLQMYADENNAELVLLWMRGVYKADHFSLSDLDKIRPYLASEFRFNSKLFAKAFLIHPSQKYPISGLEEYAQENDSLICASTKQCMEVVPRPRGKVPHTIHTTGTISIPNYSKNSCWLYCPSRTQAGSLGH